MLYRLYSLVPPLLSLSTPMLSHLKYSGLYNSKESKPHLAHHTSSEHQIYTMIELSTRQKHFLSSASCTYSLLLTVMSVTHICVCSLYNIIILIFNIDINIWSSDSDSFRRPPPLSMSSCSHLAHTQRTLDVLVIYTDLHT